jgi:hypothetical protein
VAVHDAVIVVPGIMGSELKVKENQRTIWGLRDPRWYVGAWTTGRPLNELALSDEEQSGKYGRIEATRSLRFPAFAPILRGFEPYTRMLDMLRRATCHPAAVIEFPYDWRLPVRYTANLLADAAHKHLETWRTHPACVAARRASGDVDEARLVIVAHSMGGLLARHLSLIPGASDEVRRTLTLGAPFYGAPKAALMLATGRGLPVRLPAGRVRRLAATLPGLYDLLPVYRCVDTGGDARRLTPSDVADLGGSAELAQQSLDWHANLARVLPAGHVQVVGARQRTVQSITVTGGVATGHAYTCRPIEGGLERVDLGGDETVPRESAQLPSSSAMPLAQTHGALARTAESMLVASDVLVDRRTEPWQGSGNLGLDVPDVVTAGQPMTVTLTGVSHPAHTRCVLVDLATGRPAGVPALRVRDGEVVGTVTPPDVGLYRVEAAAGGMSAVTQLLLSVEPPSTQAPED